MKKQTIITVILAAFIFVSAASIFLISVHNDDEHTYQVAETKKMASNEVKSQSTSKDSKVPVKLTGRCTGNYNVTKEEAAANVKEAIEKKMNCNLDGRTINLTCKEVNSEFIRLSMYLADVTSADGRQFECTVNGKTGKVSDINEFYSPDRNNKIFENKESNGMILKKIKDKNAKPFDKIVVENKVPTDVSIVKGDHYSVVGEMLDYNFGLTYEIKDRVLTIKSKISLDFKGHDGQHSNYVTITVPNKSLTQIDIKSGLGDIELNEITANEVNVDSGLGDFEITDCKLSRCEVNTGCGDILINGWKNGTLHASSGTGDVNIDCSYIRKQYNCQVRTNMGDENVPGKNSSDAKNEISVDVGMGDCNLSFAD